MLARILILLLVVVALVGALVYSQHRHEPLKVSGFIETDEIRVGSRVGGRVKRVAAREGQEVHVGDVLVELEPYDLNERLAEAQAQFAAKHAQYELMRAGFRPEEIAQAAAKRDALAAQLARLKAGPRKQEIAAAEARVSEATSRLEVSRSDYARVKNSLEHGSASPDEFNRAENQLNADRATLDVRRQELDQLKEGTRPEDITQADAQLREAEAALKLMTDGYRAEDVARAKADDDAAQAAVAAIRQQVDELTIRAPIDGVVEAVDLQPGDLIASNAPVLSVMNTSDLWVRAYVPENRMNLKVDQKVPVTVDSFPGRRFAAHVSFIARNAEFTPNNVQTPEERSKQVFRIKVTLDEGRDVLRPGMSADVWLEG